MLPSGLVEKAEGAWSTYRITQLYGSSSRQQHFLHISPAQVGVCLQHEGHDTCRQRMVGRQHNRKRKDNTMKNSLFALIEKGTIIFLIGLHDEHLELMIRGRHHYDKKRTCHLWRCRVCPSELIRAIRFPVSSAKETVRTNGQVNSAITTPLAIRCVPRGEIGRCNARRCVVAARCHHQHGSTRLTM